MKRGSNNLFSLKMQALKCPNISEILLLYQCDLYFIAQGLIKSQDMSFDLIFLNVQNYTNNYFMLNPVPKISSKISCC